MGVRLFVGGIRPLPPDGKPSGIVKCEREEPAWLGGEGLAGDQQADRRAHGGPDKALHQFPPSHYARLAEAFPEAAGALVAGSIGENLSVAGWDETTVCVGDVFRLGEARIQVSQPRTPCWKIDSRYGAAGMARWIDEHGLTGWYFRVLEDGQVEPGCGFDLLERTAPLATLARLWRVRRARRPDRRDLVELAAAPGLAGGWVKALGERIEWLARNP